MRIYYVHYSLDLCRTQLEDSTDDIYLLFQKQAKRCWMEKYQLLCRKIPLYKNFHIPHYRFDSHLDHLQLSSV